MVHHSAGDTAEIRNRHESFITHKLAVSFAVLASAPFILAFRGVPTPGECCAFVWSVLPLIAAVLVARTGRLVLGQALLALGLVAFAGTLVLVAGVPVAAAIAWLVLAQWEASASADRRVILAVACSVAPVLIGALLLPVAPSASPLAALLSAGLTVAYAVTLGATGLRRTPRTDAEERRTLATPVGQVAEVFGDLLVTFDANGSVDQIAGASEHLFEVPASDLCGRGLFQIVHIADRPLFLKMVGDAACTDELRSGIVRMRVMGPADGRAPPGLRFLWIEVRARRVAQAPGSAQQVVAVLRDVSSSQREEPRLASPQVSRDEFLANMSHELRTPLNAIIGFSEILGSRTLRPTEAAKQREYAQIIHQSGQHLLSVVNSILDMSKIRSGTFAILPEPFDLPSLIAQCIDMMQLKARDGEITLVSDCPHDLEALVGDRRACKQIVLNLLSNAVKFTPPHGEVRIAARPEGTAVLLIVSDTGIGIGAEDLARVGDPFFQARSSFSRPFEGTGLGLSVVRGLVGLHGGSMTIESELTLGTRVTVRLPLDCQGTGGRDAGAVIETIPRRSIARPVVVPRTASEPRIRSIA